MIINDFDSGTKNNMSREIVEYEYLFETTPRFLIRDETWELFDVFLKYLDNGNFVFASVFRRRIKKELSESQYKIQSTATGEVITFLDNWNIMKFPAY